jgi:hypothetical protein
LVKTVKSTDAAERIRNLAGMSDDAKNGEIDTAFSVYFPYKNQKSRLLAAN